MTHAQALVETAIRRRELEAEAQSLDVALDAYWSSASGILHVAERFYEVRHQDTAERCGCVLCHDWRLRRAEVERMAPLLEGHRWGNCDCATCTVGRQLHLGFIGVMNRRDLWTEMSYHAATDKTYRSVASGVMGVVRAELEDPRHPLQWWAIEGGRRPMSYWFDRIDRVLGLQCQAA